MAKRSLLSRCPSYNMGWLKVSQQLDAEKCDQVNNNVPRDCCQYSISEGVLRCRANAGRGWKLMLPAAVVPLVFHYFSLLILGDI